MSSAPILVTGIIRSGTTWLGRVLATCENTAYIHEPFNPNSVWNAAFPTPIPHYYFTDANGGIHERLFKQILLLQPDYPQRWQIDSIARHARHIARLRKSLSDESSFVPIVKDPTALYSCEWIAGKFGCRPVFVIRHPVSIMKSLLRNDWAKTISMDAVKKQPLLLDRLIQLDPFFEMYIRPKSGGPLNALERATRFIVFNYRYIVAMRQAHPDWAYESLESLSSYPANIYRLINRLGLVVAEKTQAALESDIPIDPALRHQQSLRPQSVTLSDIFAPDPSAIEWRVWYANNFAFLSAAFPDNSFLELP